MHSPEPWPLDQLVANLTQGDILRRLVEPRRVKSRPDVRECLLEDLAETVMVAAFGRAQLRMRKQVRATLGLTTRQFPDTSQPDIAVLQPLRTHFCELKSNRTDYGRFDDVFDSKTFQDFLVTTGDEAARPYEVEQDLIKLSLYPKLASGRVGSCLFLMVDAFPGGESWADVFASIDTFTRKLRTPSSDCGINFGRGILLEQRNELIYERGLAIEFVIHSGRGTCFNAKSHIIIQEE